MQIPGSGRTLFLSNGVAYWIDLFTRNDYKKIVLSSWGILHGVQGNGSLWLLHNDNNGSVKLLAGS